MATDDLHQLIHTLSQAEKRYFKVFASRHVIGEENNYVRLFDAIHAQGEYSEEKIRELFRGEKFVTRLPYEKNYLFRLILKSLRSYRQDKSPAQEVEDQLAEAQILIDKGMWERGLRMIGKAAELARAHDLYLLHLQALTLERRQLKKHTLREAEARLSENEEARAATFSALALYYQFADRHDQLFYRIRREFNLRNAEDRAWLEEIEGDALLHTDEESLQPPARLQYFLIHAYMSQLRGDFEGAHRYYAQHLALWESTPGMRENYPVGYRVAMANYLGSCNLVHHYATMERMLLKMKAPPFASPEEERESMSNFYFYQLLYLMGREQWKLAFDLRKEVSAFLDEHSFALPVSRQLAFCGNIGLIALAIGDYREGLLWTDRILDHDKLDHRADVQLFARLMQMMMHFELGNFDLMEPLARSSSRAMKSRNAWHPFEQKLTGRLKTIPELPEKDRARAWLQLQEELSRMENEESESLPQGFSDVKRWVDGKVQKSE